MPHPFHSVIDFTSFLIHPRPVSSVSHHCPSAWQVCLNHRLSSKMMMHLAWAGLFEMCYLSKTRDSNLCSTTGIWLVDKEVGDCNASKQEIKEKERLMVLKVITGILIEIDSYQWIPYKHGLIWHYTSIMLHMNLRSSKLFEFVLRQGTLSLVM